jgi:hypothetical protein
MADYEARINTKFGELIVHFNDKLDLEKKLDLANELAQLIVSKSSTFAVAPEEKVLPGMEGIYTLTPEGLPKLIVYPDSQSDIVRLALFVSPMALTVDEIRQVTGVNNPKAMRIFDTDEVMALGEKWTLSAKGRANVSSTIIPSLRAKISPQPKAQ